MATNGIRLLFGRGEIHVISMIFMIPVISVHGQGMVECMAGAWRVHGECMVPCKFWWSARRVHGGCMESAWSGAVQPMGRPEML